MTSERLGQTVRKRSAASEANIGSRFTNAATAPFSGLATLRWAEPDDVDTWNDIGFEALDGFGGGYGASSSGIILFPEGSDGEYLITTFIEAEAADGTVVLQLDDVSAGISERVGVPASEGFARLSFSTVHRFYYYDPNPVGGNVGFSVGLYEFDVTADVELVAATLTITKLRSI